ncbi:MAG: outer membrane beta-barrel protein [Prevotella sp.]
MKRFCLILVTMLVTMASHAQFEAGKYYVGASLSSLGFSYNGSQEGAFGLQARGGYLFDDNLMATGQLTWEKQSMMPSYLKVGVGARYYIVQNGLYFGAQVNYLRHSSDYDDLQPGIQVGYAFFLNKNVTVEPEIYYDQSIKSHKDFSTVGFRIGVGIYL